MANKPKVKEAETEDEPREKNEPQTYEELARLILSLPPELQRQTIQVVKSSPFDIAECMPVIGVDTIANFGFGAARSIYDNKYHGNDLVIFCDGNQFAKDGAIAYEMLPSRKMKPIYGKNGKTNKKDQEAPDDQPDTLSKMFSRLEESLVIKNRLKTMDEKIMDEKISKKRKKK